MPGIMKYSMNISQWVRQWSRIQPEKTAICFEGREISYLRLHRQACRIAGYFMSNGLSAGQRVAVLLDNCPEFIQIYLACSRVGLILVPFNTRWAADEVNWAIENCEPAVIIFHRKYKKKIMDCRGNSLLPEIAQIEIPEDTADFLETYGPLEKDRAGGDDPVDTRAVIPVPPESPQVIMYTSGTTGRPKGAVLSHRKTFFNCLNAQFFLDLQAEDRMLLSVPLFHSGGLFIQASPVLYRGAGLVIQSKFDAVATYKDIRKHRITQYSAVPTIMKRLLAVPPEMRDDISSLRICAVGGEKMTDTLVKQCLAAGFPMRQIMGQTETSIILWASGKDLNDYPGTVGKPVFHGQVALIDSNGNPTGAGDVGEIAVSGPTLMSGYWRFPKLSKEAIRDGWLYTGDLARRNEQGYFFLVDRAKDMYISGGENVYPVEVERVLKAHDSISDAAVIGVPDAVWGQTGHAFVIKKPGAALTEQDIRTFCEGRLARFKWPQIITFRDHFPRTALGKIMKENLRATSAR
jgi:fatty-acyl-CoA synthase